MTTAGPDMSQIPWDEVRSVLWDRTPLTLGEAFKSFANALAAPNAPYLLVKMLRAAERIEEAFQQCNSNAAAVKLIRGNHTLLREGIKFVTKRLTTQELQQLLSQIYTGSAFYRNWNGMIADPRSADPDRVIDDLCRIVATLCNCIALSLSELPRGTYRQGPTGTVGISPWPLRPGDVIPHGSKTTVDTLQRWGKILSPSGSSRHSLYRLAKELVRHHEPFARQLLNPDSLHDFVLNAPLEVLESLVFAKVRQDQSQDERLSTLGGPIRDIVDFFHALRVADQDKFTVILMAKPQAFASAFIKLENLLESFPPPWRSTRGRVSAFIAIANRITQGNVKLHEGIDGARRVNQIVREMDASADIVERPVDWAWDSEVGRGILMGLVEARKGGCCNVLCAKAATDAAGTRSCTGCGLLRYCSSECTKEAWKAELLPHKSLCFILARVRTKLGPETWDRLADPDFTFEEFASVCNQTAPAKFDLGSAQYAVLALRQSRARYVACLGTQRDWKPDVRSFLDALFDERMDIYLRVA